MPKIRYGYCAVGGALFGIDPLEYIRQEGARALQTLDMEKVEYPNLVMDIEGCILAGQFFRQEKVDAVIINFAGCLPAGELLRLARELQHIPLVLWGFGTGPNLTVTALLEATSDFTKTNTPFFTVVGEPGHAATLADITATLKAIDAYRFVQNSRAKETLERWTQAEAVKSQAFGMVVGNPPWGGVLRPGRPLAKGLAGGGSKSRDYTKDYASARGKYDIYVLFLERGMEQVKPKGSLAFVTQNRYLSREYGAVIRKLLVQKREDEVRAVELIADLGEVGGMFFFPEQTNYPCLTVVRKADLPRAKLIRVETDGTFPVNPEAKHSFVESLKRVCSRLDTEDKASEEPMSGVLVRGLAVDQALLQRWADEGVPWDLTRCESAVVPRIRKTRATVPTVPLVKAFIVQQGATTGRADRILLIPQEVVHRHQLEDAVLRKVIRGRDISPFRIDWSGLVAVYPYNTQGKVMNLGKGIWESDATRAKERIEEEIALGHVIAPRSSLYLAQFYGELANRMFEGKSIRELGKEWFEWHRSRKPELVVTAPKIVGRRQIHEASFAVDAEGYLLMDSCIALVPHRNSDAWASLVEYFRSILDREPKESEILRFAVAILNHPVSDSRLKQGGTPQRGNYYTIGGEHLGRLSIRLPTTVKAKAIARHLAMGKEDDASPFLS